MSISPIITFKAGKCNTNFTIQPPKITPIETPGFLYLYSEDDLLHFCWRARSASLASPDLDLIMVPEDAYFTPYVGPSSSSNPPNTSPINGRFFVLKFRSSDERIFFWLQSREQPPGQPKRFSTRDLKLGQIVNSLLQGEEFAASVEIAERRVGSGDGLDGDDEDGDEMMEDVAGGGNHDGGGADNAGGDGTGGEGGDGGEESGQGGASGARAPTNTTDTVANATIQNFINSLLARTGTGQAPQQPRDKLFTTLNDLLTPTTTLPLISTLPDSTIENLLVHHLPPSLTFLAHQVDDPDISPDEDVLRASVQALEPAQQRDIVRRVLRSPQFSQGLATLTSALRDGGLPTIGEALGVPVENRGYMAAGGGVPVSGGNAVEAFLEGVKKSVQTKPGDGGEGS